MENNRSAFPVIDLEENGESEMDQSCKKLREACEEFGVCRIINHGISPTLMAEMKEVARSLFDRPIEIKRRNVDVLASSGYVAPSQASPLHEALGFYALGSFCDQLGATSHERDVLQKYSKAVYELILEISGKLTKSIGLLGDDLFKDWPWQLKINKYDFNHKDIGIPAMRTHTDSGFLTILQDDDNVEGLEFINKNTGEFEAVDPWPSSFLLLIGDLGKVWSNGRFYNAMHTVRCKKAKTRFSIIALFFSPDDEAIEAPLELVDEEHPRLYAPLVYKDYRELRLSKKMLTGEALEFIRLSSDVSPCSTKI